MVVSSGPLSEISKPKKSLKKFEGNSIIHLGFGLGIGKVEPLLQEKDFKHEDGIISRMTGVRGM